MSKYAGPFINNLSPTPGSRRKRARVGRGTGSGSDKTAGRGHKGQKSRAGSGPKGRFEGGQMPLHRRLPKFGFHSRIGRKTARVRLSEINQLEGDQIDLQALRSAGVINRNIRRARIFLSGEIERAVHVHGIKVTCGARAAIEKSGGSVVSDPETARQKQLETGRETEAQK